MREEKELYERLNKLKDTRIDLIMQDDLQDERTGVESVDDVANYLSEVIESVSKRRCTPNTLKKYFEYELEQAIDNKEYENIHVIGKNIGKKYAARGIVQREISKYAISHAFTKLAKEYYEKKE